MADLLSGGVMRGLISADSAMQSINTANFVYNVAKAKKDEAMIERARNHLAQNTNKVNEALEETEVSLEKNMEEKREEERMEAERAQKAASAKNGGISKASGVKKAEAGSVEIGGEVIVTTTSDGEVISGEIEATAENPDVPNIPHNAAFQQVFNVKLDIKT